MKSALRADEARTSSFQVTVASPATAPEVKPLEERSKLGQKLAAGEFVTMVEIVPPKGSDPAKELAAAKYLRSVGIDAVNIPDSPRASARMGNQALCTLISAGMRHRDDSALHLPRPECAEHSERSAGGLRTGTAQPDLHYRRSAKAGKLSRTPRRSSTWMRLVW